MWDVVHFTRQYYNIQNKTDDEVFELWLNECIKEFSNVSPVPGAIEFL